MTPERESRGGGGAEGFGAGPPETVLVICVGNVCRSPMAEALLAVRLRSAGHGTRVASAGVAACVGMPADPISIVLMEERGLDIGAHRGRQLLPETVGDGTLLLVTAAAQGEWIARRRRALASRIALLGQHGEGDIADPVGRGRGEFEAALAAIDRSIDGWLAQPGWSSSTTVAPPAERGADAS